jgi:hypothetical protein
MLTSKNVSETLAEPISSIFGSKAWNRTSTAVSQHAQIVDPMAMIRVIMRPENAIQPVNIVVEQLLAKIRRSID